MNLNDLFNEEKVRLDPHCWDNKKIGKPKTKVKGGVRVNNCVPAESVEELNEVDRNKPFDMNRPLPGDPRLAQWQHNHPVEPIQIDPLGLPGGGGRFRPSNMSRNIATQRNVGGKEIPSLGQSGKVVTSPTMDKVLTKLGGKNVETTPGPTVKSGSTNVQLDPAADVPAYVRQGKPDPSTTPKPGTKLTVKVRPGETMDQAVQRTKSEQEFGKFLQGQSGQSFGAGSGRGGQGGPTATQATSGSDQVPTIKLPNGQTIPDPARVSPSGQYGRFDKIARDDEIAVDAMVKKARENAQARDSAQDNKEKQLGLEPGSLRPRSQWEQERAAALRSEEEKLGLPPGSLSSRSQRQPEQTTTPPESKKTDSILSKLLGGGLEEASRKKREQPEVDYDAIDHDKSVARLRHLAGIGPMKTVWDPAKRVYKNVPTAVQPKK